MKAKILTEYGNSIGYGHLSRCVALYDEIKDRNIEVELIIDGEFEYTNILKSRDFKLENWKNYDYLDINVTCEDYVIVDSYKAEKEHYSIISKKAKKALFIDDYNRINYPKGIIVNPILDSRQVSYHNTNNIILKGSKYVILRKGFNNINNKNIRKKANKVLIIMGGTDVINLTPIIIENICNKFNHIDFNIILNSLNSKIKLPSYNLSNLKFHDNLNELEMKKLMEHVDIAITTAGQTIYELIITLTPFIAIQVAKNQENNLSILKNNISSKITLKYNENSFIDKLYNKLNKILAYDVRKELIKKMENIIDGKGKKRIIDVLFDDTIDYFDIQLRNAQKKDIKNVFKLSNEDYVRKYSLYKKKITWEEHLKWYNKVLTNDNYVIYIITDRKDSFLGQIRFSIEKTQATVSISISKKIIGKGLSRNLLKKSIKRFLEHNYQITEIIAFVSIENIASLKVFTSLNFVLEATKDGVMKLVLGRKNYVN